MKNLVCRGGSLSSNFGRATTTPSLSVTANLKAEKERKATFAVDKHSAFQELHLKQLKYENPIGRVRQHVNPLSTAYQTKSESLNWEEVFKNPELPLIVDAGSGCGRFALLAAKNESTPVNYLGTEIRRPLVGRANFWARELSLDDRVHFTFSNITISLETLLRGYPGVVQGIYIQFPDPSFKKRKTKRHIVQAQFVQACGEVLHSEGMVFMQSDVESCGIYMRNMFDVYGTDKFVPHPLHTRNISGSVEDEFMNQKLKWSQLSWLKENPIGFPTQREVYSQEQGLMIYRTLLIKM